MPFIAMGALAGGLVGGTALTGAAFGGFTATGALVGAAVGGGIAMATGSGIFKRDQMKFPDLSEAIKEFPKTTIEELESQEEGWRKVLERARGRRETILVRPQLTEIEPYIQRATLLAG